jgi:hypothetical protein
VQGIHNMGRCFGYPCSEIPAEYFGIADSIVGVTTKGSSFDAFNEHHSRMIHYDIITSSIMVRTTTMYHTTKPCQFTLLLTKVLSRQSVRTNVNSSSNYY